MTATLPPIDTDFLLQFLTGLLDTPSPTGYTGKAISFVEQALAAFPELELKRTRKGALVADWPGRSSETRRGLTAHTDTLGAMVKEIKPNGRLKLSRIGGFAWNTVEGEGCNVFTRKGASVRGSLLITKASAHVHSSEVSDLKRSDENLEVRLDAITSTADETRNLGIGVGDFVAFDPRVEVTDGFVRSRYLDDKACVACLVAAVQAMHRGGLQPAQSSILHISNYEEVGHGAASGFPADLAELLVVDMAAVGDGQTSDEFHATLCVKDTGGPYHHGMNERLRLLADQYAVPYKVDIYPHYGSDGEAYWRAGGDVAVALIGPGVDASHNYERTHIEALLATTKWILAYLLNP
jgi:putative aminopeptidase FrvX